MIHTVVNEISASDSERAVRAKSQFLVDRSHEIRTLMTRIIGMTDLTLMTELSEEQREYLTVVKSSTGQLLKVLKDMQDYSKIQGEALCEENPECRG